MEVIGTVGAIVGIIDVASRIISALADTRRRFGEANLTIQLLSGQIATVKAALQQIHGLVSENLQDDQHFDFIMNLDTAVSCCNLLIRILDDQISKLVCGSDGDDATFRSKMTIVLESTGTEACLQRLDRQIAALNLLITAHHAYLHPFLFKIKCL